MLLPFTRNVTLSGHTAFDLSVPAILEPFTVPSTVPPLLLLGFGNVIAQVPENADPNWAIVARRFPFPP